MTSHKLSLDRNARDHILSSIPLLNERVQLWPTRKGNYELVFTFSTAVYFQVLHRALGILLV